VKINIPHMLIGLRELQHHAGRKNRGERLAYWAWKEVLRRPWLYRLLLRVSRWLLRPLARDGWLRRLPGPGAGWTAARDFPAPAKRSFRERWNTL
jgi:L-lactate dehydrogenase complex protein LldF